jgi:hypothetical protein
MTPQTKTVKALTDAMLGSPAMQTPRKLAWCLDSYRIADLDYDQGLLEQAQVLITSSMEAIRKLRDEARTDECQEAMQDIIDMLDDVLGDGVRGEIEEFEQALINKGRA